MKFKFVENPVEPRGFLESLDAFFNLSLFLRYHSNVDTNTAKRLVSNANRTEDAVLDYGEKLFQLRELNKFYDDIGIAAIDGFATFDQDELDENRKTIYVLLKYADDICKRFLNRTPFAPYYESDEILDDECMYAYIHSAQELDPNAGYDLKNLMFKVAR